MYLFLDDERMPGDVKWVRLPNIAEEYWTIVRNYENFRLTIEWHFEKSQHSPMFIAFDHDLADIHYKNLINGKRADEGTDEKTGYHCAKWLTDFCLDNNLLFPRYVVHSQNPIGKENLISLIENFKEFQKNKE